MGRETQGRGRQTVTLGVIKLQLLEIENVKDYVKLQFPYELSFLSVFWVTSKSNHKYMFDVVKKVFNRSGRNKKHNAERHQAFELVYSRSHMTLYRVPEHSYYRKSKE